MFVKPWLIAEDRDETGWSPSSLSTVWNMLQELETEVELLLVLTI